MEYTYAIMTSCPQASANLLMKIKKLTGLSLGEIKTRVSEGLPIYECNCADEDGMVLLLALNDALESEGAKSVFLDCGEPAPIQYLMNALEAYREIDVQEHD